MLPFLSRGFWWRDLDLPDRSMLLRLVVPCYMILLAGTYLALGGGGMGGFRGRLLTLVVLPLLSLFVGRFLLALLGGFASTAIGALDSSSGGDPHVDSFSIVDTWVMQGEWERGVRYLEQIAPSDPRSLIAMRRAADLVQQHADDPAWAERCWLAVRDRDRDGRHRVEIANRLIDLYRNAGEHDAMRGELIRLAREQAGTIHGEQARHALRRLVADEYGEPDQLR